MGSLEVNPLAVKLLDNRLYMHITHIQGSGSIVYFYIDGTLPQAGINLPAQSEVCYQTTALPPSHHGWISCDLKVMDMKWQEM